MTMMTKMMMMIDIGFFEAAAEDEEEGEEEGRTEQRGERRDGEKGRGARD